MSFEVAISPLIPKLTPQLLPALFTPFLKILLGSALHQSPDTVVKEGQPVTLSCSQAKTSYFNMYWYKQERVQGPRLQLVIFAMEDSGGDSAIEKEFLDRFKSTGMKNSKLNLSLEKAQLGDSGTYFCAKQDYTVRQLWREPNIKDR